MSAGITLVTGATGHLGANLVHRLLADGEQVRVMMRHERDNGAMDGLDVERVYADLRNSEECPLPCAAARAFIIARLWFRPFK